MFTCAISKTTLREQHYQPRANASPERDVLVCTQPNVGIRFLRAHSDLEAIPVQRLVCFNEQEPFRITKVAWIIDQQLFAEIDIQLRSLRKSAAWAGS